MYYGVNPKKEVALEEKMRRFGVKESDIIEKFIRAGGPGGEHLNKTSSCVYLKHLPTGIEVKCSQERSQTLNRFLARRILANKIEQLILGIKSEEQRKIEKIKRQKRKRSKRAKEKVLREKHIISDKKKLRGKIKSYE